MWKLSAFIHRKIDFAVTSLLRFGFLLKTMKSDQEAFGQTGPGGVKRYSLEYEAKTPRLSTWRLSLCPDRSVGMLHRRPSGREKRPSKGKASGQKSGKQSGNRETNDDEARRRPTRQDAFRLHRAPVQASTVHSASMHLCKRVDTKAFSSLSTRYRILPFLRSYILCHQLCPGVAPGVDAGERPG